MLSLLSICSHEKTSQTRAMNFLACKMDLYIHSRSVIFTDYSQHTACMRSACCLYRAEWVGGYYMSLHEYASSAHPLAQWRSNVPKPWALNITHSRYMYFRSVFHIVPRTSTSFSCMIPVHVRTESKVPSVHTDTQTCRERLGTLGAHGYSDMQGASWYPRCTRILRHAGSVLVPSVHTDTQTCRERLGTLGAHGYSDMQGASWYPGYSDMQGASWYPRCTRILRHAGSVLVPLVHTDTQTCGEHLGTLGAHGYSDMQGASWYPRCTRILRHAGSVVVPSVHTDTQTCRERLGTLGAHGYSDMQGASLGTLGAHGYSDMQGASWYPRCTRILRHAGSVLVPSVHTDTQTCRERLLVPSVHTDTQTCRERLGTLGAHGYSDMQGASWYPRYTRILRHAGVGNGWISLDCLGILCACILGHKGM